MQNKENRKKKRNENVRKKFNTTVEKNPHWKTDVILQQIAIEFYLSKRTIEAIIKGEGIYSY